MIIVGSRHVTASAIPHHALSSAIRGATMQMIYCPNCGKLTGFKRALGFGTFFMVLLTCGLWLLVIPFYPVRCINCGLQRPSRPVLASILIGCLVLFAIASLNIK